MFFLYAPPSIKVESLWINWDECAEKAFLEVATEYEWSGYLTTLASITTEETSPGMETRMQEDCTPESIVASSSISTSSNEITNSSRFLAPFKRNNGKNQ